MYNNDYVESLINKVTTDYKIINEGSYTLYDFTEHYGICNIKIYYDIIELVAANVKISMLWDYENLERIITSYLHGADEFDEVYNELKAKELLEKL